jgi:hypothetical protein
LVHSFAKLITKLLANRLAAHLQQMECIHKRALHIG